MISFMAVKNVYLILDFDLVLKKCPIIGSPI